MEVDEGAGAPQPAAETQEQRLERLEAALDERDDVGEPDFLTAAAEVAKVRWIVARRRTRAAKTEQKEIDADGTVEQKAAAAEKVQLAEAEAELAEAKAKLAEAESKGQPTEALNNRVTACQNAVNLFIQARLGKRSSAVSAEGEPRAKRPRTFAEPAFEESLARGDATFEIAEGENLSGWVPAPELTLFARELVEAKVEELDANVHFYQLARGLDADSQLKSGLITRRCTREIASAILRDIEANQARTISVLTGAPGIGKTRTLVWLLRQVLRGEGGKHTMLSGELHAHALYFSLKEDQAYLFVRWGARVFAWRRRNVSRASSILFEFPNSVVLVDPREAANGGADFAMPTCGHLVLAASSNSKHYKNLDKDALTGRLSERFMFFMPSWSPEELEAVRGKIGEAKLSAETVRLRAETVGGAPRYTLSSSKFDKRVRQINSRVAELSKEMVDKALVGDIDGEGEKNVPGCFFAYKRGKAINVPAAAATHGFTGYEYSQPRVVHLSDFARLVIAGHRRASILNPLGREVAQHASVDGYHFEDVVRSDVIFGGDFDVSRLHYKRGRTKPDSVPDRIHLDAASVTDVVQATGMVQARCLAELERLLQHPPARRSVLVPCAGFPFIDLADSHGNLVQATISAPHDRNGVEGVLTAAGLVKRQADGTLAATGLARASLRLFWAVPRGRYVDWCKKAAQLVPVGRTKKQKADAAVLNKCLQDNVEQYVLCVPAQNPRAPRV